MNSKLIGAAADKITLTFGGNSNGNHIIPASVPSSFSNQDTPSITIIILPRLEARSKNLGKSQLNLSLVEVTSLVNSNFFFKNVINRLIKYVTLVECLVQPIE